MFVDDDGQAYLYFGGNGESNARIIRLNEDMISTSGSAIALTVPYFFEAAWMHQRNGLYYFSYSTNPSNGLRIDYLTGDSPTGPFTYRGIVAGQPPTNNNNNHAAIFQFGGVWYHACHNRFVATQAGIPATYRRNLAIERLDYNSDGTIQQVPYTTDGMPQVGHVDPYTRAEAETMNAQVGIETEPCSEGGMNVTEIDSGDFIKIRGVDFGDRRADAFNARVASAAGGGTIELRLGSPTGTLIGTCTVAGTDGGQSWITVNCGVSGATGVQDLHLVFAGSGSSLFNIDWWQFTEAPAPPQITGQPRSLILAPGTRLSLWVEASGSPPLHYQWFKSGAPIAGATGRFFEVAAASAGDAGSYAVEVTNGAGAATSDPATIVIDASVSARLVNMSVRAPLAGGAVLIPGFVRSGTAPRQLLIRAVGPTLQGFGVVNAHADPALNVLSDSLSLVTNDNWGDASNSAAIIGAAETLGAFALTTGSRDAAALFELAPGPYTTHVAGVGNSSGVVLFELYEGTGTGSRFANLSARGDIGTGEAIMIPGFSIAGSGATTLVIRAVGPSLEAFGVTNRLTNPALTLFDGSTPILTNNDWSQAPDVPALRAATEAVGAFPLTNSSSDAAALVVVMPGTYTAQASGAGGATGNVLVEVYEVQ